MLKYINALNKLVTKIHCAIIIFYSCKINLKNIETFYIIKINILKYKTHFA